MHYVIRTLNSITVACEHITFPRTTNVVIKKKGQNVSEDGLILLILYQRKIGARITPELPLIEKTYICDVSVEQTSDGEVHVYAHPNEPVLVHQQDSRTGKVKFT